MNKTINNTNNNNTSNNISLSGRNKIISTRIIFKQKYNNKFNCINNNNYGKTIQFKTSKNSNNNNNNNNNNNSNSKKYNFSYTSFNKNTEKISIEKIRKKIAEISKIINNKNLKGYHLKNKANTKISGLFNTNQNSKINKNKNKAELFPKNNNNNGNQTINKLNSERKSFINNNKKLMLSDSFVNKPKVRIVDKNNIKRFINFNK